MCTEASWSLMRSTGAISARMISATPLHHETSRQTLAPRAPVCARACALVHALKFRGALPLAGVMAAQITTNLPSWAVPRDECRLGAVYRPPDDTRRVVVVPVPPAPQRRRARGFDAAELRARGVA